MNSSEERNMVSRREDQAASRCMHYAEASECDLLLDENKEGIRDSRSIHTRSWMI